MTLNLLQTWTKKTKNYIQLKINLKSYNQNKKIIIKEQETNPELHPHSKFSNKKKTGYQLIQFVPSSTNQQLPIKKQTTETTTSSNVNTTNSSMTTPSKNITSLKSTTIANKQIQILKKTTPTATVDTTDQETKKLQTLTQLNQSPNPTVKVRQIQIFLLLF